MGCDGGTIPKRHELVKGPRKVEKVGGGCVRVAGSAGGGCGSGCAGPGSQAGAAAWEERGPGEAGPVAPVPRGLRQRAGESEPLRAACGAASGRCGREGSGGCSGEPGVSRRFCWKGEVVRMPLGVWGLPVTLYAARFKG